MTLERKLLGLTLIPLLVAAVPTLLLLSRADRAVREMEGLDVLSNLVWKMSDVEKGFDHEADNWYMFRQEHANDPAPVLAEARKVQDAARVATDAALADYDRTLAGIDPSLLPETFREILAGVAEQRARLHEIRALLYRRHSDKESEEIATYYLQLRSKLGGALGVLIDQTTNQEVARKLQVLVKTIALRKSGMDAGRKVFWAIQTYNNQGRLIPIELASVIASAGEVADAHWNEAMALSSGKARQRFRSYAAQDRWGEAIEVIRGTAHNLSLSLPPPLLEEPEWSRRYDFIDKEVGVFAEWLREDFVATCAAIRADLRFERNATLVSAIATALVVLWLSRRLARRIAIPLTCTASQLADAVRTFSAQAEQLASASEALSTGASDQAASIEETSASLEELAASTRLNEETAARAVKSTGEAASSAADGQHLLSVLGTTVSDVEASGGAISRILKTIDEIAFQTNILALNAAVEAARAGEAGAGFAVVADEVRSLARRSKDAARETTELLAGGGTSDEGSRGVVEGLARIREDSGRVATHFQSIADKIKETDAQSAQIARASAEQAKSLEVIATSIHKINEITQSNAASSEQAAAAAEGLSRHADELNDTVRLLEKTLGMRRAENREQKTENREQRTEDRRLKTEDRGPRTEDARVTAPHAPASDPSVHQVHTVHEVHPTRS